MTRTSAYNVGIDIERAGRFESVADDDNLRALFTDEERRYCAGAGDAAASYAGTWCAKEAIVKALAPWVVLDPRRVTVERTGTDAQVAVSGWSAAASGVTVRVAISDRRPLATAFAFASGPGRT
ncbi:MAG: 4-phosphopantetheinyl transferase superfamily [Chloroflexota bacterium]|jgi:phosphopantetheine--protein transferase-like protein|nr:4-phosphopantetheinyl transferase superfamily [Chloroflexota bacterium]